MAATYKEHLDDKLDEALEDTFPASDPIAVTPPGEAAWILAGGLDRQQRKKELAAAEQRRAAGRYTLEEAATAIASGAGEARELMLDKFITAAATGSLPRFHPGEYASLGACGRDDVCTWYEEVDAKGLNDWLAEHEPRITYRYPESDGKKPRTEKQRRTDTYGRLVHAALNAGNKSTTEVARWLQQQIGQTVNDVEVDAAKDGWLEVYDRIGKKSTRIDLNPRGPLKDRVSRAKKSSDNRA